MAKTGVFSMSPIPDIGQLRYLPLKARCCDCFFRPEQNSDRKKYWTGWRAGCVSRRNEEKPVHRDGANLCTGYAIAQPQKTKTVFFLKVWL